MIDADLLEYARQDLATRQPAPPSGERLALLRLLLGTFGGARRLGTPLAA